MIHLWQIQGNIVSKEQLFSILNDFLVFILMEIYTAFISVDRFDDFEKTRSRILSSILTSAYDKCQRKDLNMAAINHLFETLFDYKKLEQEIEMAIFSNEPRDWLMNILVKGEPFFKVIMTIWNFLLKS